uniref:Uncharacterized protein n=1 Tax=Romanomermis culicivorax TaxID=13658 RepID=A0A915K5I0_ROMCU
MVASYQLKKTVTVTAAVAMVPAPLACFTAQGPWPKLPTDSALEVIHRMQLINLIDSLSLSDQMWAIWLTYLAKKYPHLPWALLNELFEDKAPRAANMVLSAPITLSILGPDVTQPALKFISNGTIWTTPVNKLLLEGQPSSPAVDTVRHVLKQASWITQPVLAVAASPPTMMTSAQMLWAIAQQQPLAATINLPTVVANSFGETMYLVNDDSIIETLSFPMATAPWSLKIGVLREIRLRRGLALTSPLRSRYCWTGTMKNNAAQLAEAVKLGISQTI